MKEGRLNKTKRLVFDAMLAGTALVIFIVELQLPSLSPIPGIKLGLSNIITLVTMFITGPLDAIFVLLVRILLGCLLSGQVMALLYSLAGGVLSYLLMFVLRPIISDKQIFILSILGGLIHNMGQLTVAALLTHTTAVFYYLPLLALSGMLAGAFTGGIAQYTIIHLRKLSGILKD